MPAPAPRLILLLAAALAAPACNPHLGQINSNPNKYYEEQVRVVARVSRRQIVHGEALLELADVKGRRILAVTPEADAPAIGDWVKIRGILVADRMVGDALVYDVIVAESVRGARKPWTMP